MHRVRASSRNDRATMSLSACQPKNSIGFKYIFIYKRIERRKKKPVRFDYLHLPLFVGLFFVL